MPRRNTRMMVMSSAADLTGINVAAELSSKKAGAAAAAPKRARAKRTKGPHKCKTCRRVFQRKSDLTKHERVHSGVRPYKCTVSGCGKAFAQKTNLTVHSRSHTGEKPFTCDECNTSFAAQSTLRQHKTTHSDEKPYVCKTCSKGFRRDSNLQRHMLSHTGKKPFKCTAPHCKKAFSVKITLVRHMRRHTGERPFECSLCQTRFRVKSHLAVHMRTHTGEKPFVCTVPGCSATYGYKVSLVSHVRKVHGPAGEHACPQCSLSFSEPWLLAAHLSSHPDVEDAGSAKSRRRSRARGAR